MTVITSLRVVQDDKGERFLMGCYAKSPCGCQIKGAGICYDPLRIEYCPTHGAAGELLEAVHAIERHWSAGNFSRLGGLWDQMDNAIAAAQPK